MPSFLAPRRPSWQRALSYRRGPRLGNRHSVWVPLSISDFGNRGVLPGCPHFGSDSITLQPCLSHQFTPS